MKQNRSHFATVVALTHQLQVSPNSSTLSVIHQSKWPNQDFHFYTSLLEMLWCFYLSIEDAKQGVYLLPWCWILVVSGREYWASQSFSYPPPFIRSPLLSCEGNLIFGRHLVVKWPLDTSTDGRHISSSLRSAKQRLKIGQTNSSVSVFLLQTE